MDGSLVLGCWLVIWLSCCVCFKIWFCSIFCGEPAPGPDFFRIKIFEPHSENFDVFPPTMPLFGSQCPVLGTSCAANLDFFFGGYGRPGPVLYALTEISVKTNISRQIWNLWSFSPKIALLASKYTVQGTSNVRPSIFLQIMEDLDPCYMLWQKCMNRFTIYRFVYE